MSLTGKRGDIYLQGIMPIVDSLGISKRDRSAHKNSPILSTPIIDWRWLKLQAFAITTFLPLIVKLDGNFP